MTSFQRDFSLVGTMADLPAIGEFVEEACCQADVEPGARFDLLLAVDEACCNVFEHAYGRAGGKLDLRFETRDRDVVITVHDHGQAFDPGAVPEPDTNKPLEERPLGGLGLHLMRRLMDKVLFAFSPESGNTLVMEKHRVVPGESKTKSSKPRRR